jgi:hypothetical protein
MCIAVGVGIAGLVSAGVGAYESSQQQGISQQAVNLAKTTQGEQEQYNQQLQQLLANPNAFFSSAPYQAAFGQGVQAVQRGQAATNPPGPGQAASLQAFGQTFGQQQLMSQEQLLASLSGATAASSPASSLGTAAGAQAQAGNTLSGVLASLGFTAGLYNQQQQPGYYGIQPGGGATVSPGYAYDATSGLAYVTP